MLNHQVLTAGERFKWRIQKPATELADAARAKQLFHWERKKWWEDRLTKTLKEARENGVTIIESDAVLYSNSTKGFTPRIGVDEKFQAKASESHLKAVEHENLRTEYQAWVEMLDGAGNQAFELDVKDYQFFFGNKSQVVDVPEEE